MFMDYPSKSSLPIVVMDQTQVCYIQNKSTTIVIPNVGNKINQRGGAFIDSEKFFQNNFKLSFGPIQCNLTGIVMFVLEINHRGCACKIAIT
jgi:hypothetical protein